MASKRFEIDMALNASEVAKGAKDAETALTQLEQSVGDVADESASSGREVDSFADKLVDAARKAGKSDDDIADALRKSGLSADDTRRALSKVGNEAQDTGRTGRRSFESLEDSMRGVQRETERTGETVADIGTKSEQAGIQINRAMGTDIRQGINAVGDLLDGRIAGGMSNMLNATTSISQHLPLLGVGIAAAAGVAGPILAGLQEQQNEYNKSVERMKQFYADAWKEAVEGGLNYIDQATVIKEMHEIMFNTDRAGDYKRALEDAAALSIDVNTVIAGMAGSEEAANEVRARGNALIEKQKQLLAEAVEAGQTVYDTDRRNALDALDKLDEVNNRWRERSDTYDEFKAKAAAAQDAESAYLLSVLAGATKATKEVDKLGNTLITLPDDTKILIEANTGKATADVKKFEGDVDKTVQKLDGSKIDIIVDAALRDAQNKVNQFIKTNNGKSFKIHGRFVSPIGGDV